MPVTLIDDEERNMFEYEDSVFYYRRVSSSKKAALIKKHTTVRRGVEKTDYAAMMEDLMDHMILDWKNVVNRDGTEVNCTRENKMMLPDNVKIEIIDRADASELVKEKKQEEELKN